MSQIFLVEGLSVRIMGIGSHISLLSWRSKHHDFTITPRNKRNSKSANFVASVSRGRMQSNAKAKCFLWPDCAGYLSIDI